MANISLKRRYQPQNVRRQMSEEGARAYAFIQSNAMTCQLRGILPWISMSKLGSIYPYWLALVIGGI